MRIQKLSLTHFKGIKSFTLDTGGKNCTVEGANGIGKTTLADAALWLLTGRDSLGSASFEIKGLNAIGEVAQHGLDHTVEMVVQFSDTAPAFDTDRGLDGQNITTTTETTLRKVYREVWKTQRGAAEKQFTGHETEHFIDGVPKDKKDFDLFVASICDSKKLQILSKPSAFNELPDSQKEGPGWQQRRRWLVSTFGDVTDSEVMAGDKKFKPLVEAMKGKTVEDYKAVAVRAKKESVEKRKGIPGRIDELARQLDDPSPAADTARSNSAPQGVDELRARLRELNAQRATIDSGGEVAEKTKRLRELEAEGQTIYNRLRREVDDAANEAARVLRQANFVLDGDKKLLDQHHAEWDSLVNKLTRIDGYLTEKRAEFAQINAVTLDMSKAVKDVCPVCQQPIPPESLAAAQELALAEFNAKKSERLTKNRAEGLELKADREEVVAKIASLESSIEDLSVRIQSLTEQRDEAMMADPKELDPNHHEIVANLVSRQAIETEITAAKDGTGDNGGELYAVDMEIVECEAEIRAHDEAAARQAAQAESRERIKELEAQEKTMGAEIETLDRMLYLIEEFTRTKVAMLDDKINSHFSLVQWKLSEVQINEGVKECCICTMKGTPWSGLSTGEKIVAGLDVISTLSEAWGLTMPCWVDNSESLTEHMVAPGQIIALRAVEGVRKLKVAQL